MHDSKNTSEHDWDDAQLAAHFEQCTVAKEDWDHCAHLRVAHYYLSCFPYEEALARMRVGLIKYLQRQGVIDTATRGYHETMTQFWLHIIAALMAGHAEERTSQEQPGTPKTSDEFLSQNSFLLDKSLWRMFYTRRRIVSMEAKAEFVPPDITPLPEFAEARIPRYAPQDRTDDNAEFIPSESQLP